VLQNPKTTVLQDVVTAPHLEAFESSPHPYVILFEDSFSFIHTYISQIISPLH